MVRRLLGLALLQSGCALNSPADAVESRTFTQRGVSSPVLDSATGRSCAAASGLCTEHGFANAVRENSQIDGRWVKLEEGRGFLVLPASGNPPTAAVVLLHTAYGLDDEMRWWAARLAAHNLAVIAVDLYGGEVAKTVEEVPVLREAANARLGQNLASIVAGVNFLRGDESVKASRVALVGFSYGGAWATYLISNLEDVAGAVSYAGEAFGAENPIAALSRPLLLVAGGVDHQLTGDRLGEIQISADEAGVPLEVLAVQGGHGLWSPTRKAYNPAGAERSFSAMLDFLSRVLDPPSP